MTGVRPRALKVRPHEHLSVDWYNLPGLMVFPDWPVSRWTAMILLSVTVGVMREVLQLTLAELASVLDPPVSPAQLQHLVAAVGLQPGGYRRNGQPGRPQATYDAETIMRLHGCLAPWLATCGTSGRVSGASWPS